MYHFLVIAGKGLAMKCDKSFGRYKFVSAAIAASCGDFERVARILAILKKRFVPSNKYVKAVRALLENKGGQL